MQSNTDEDVGFFFSVDLEYIRFLGGEVCNISKTYTGRIE